MYELIIDDVALDQLRDLPKEIRRNIGYRLDHSKGISKSWPATNGVTGFESAPIGRVCCETEEGSL
jgi:phage-related protein